MIEQESHIYGTRLLHLWSEDARKTAALGELGVVADKGETAMRILAIGLYDAEWTRAFSGMPRATTGVSVRTTARVNAIAFEAASRISHGTWLEYARTTVPKIWD